MRYVEATCLPQGTRDVTGERANMSGRIWDKHYDKGSAAEKAEQRKYYLGDV
jgi:hypothetical protein